MSGPTNVLTVWNEALAEVCEAATEYLANSRVLSEQCEPAQTRLEQALSQFTDQVSIQPKDYRGMEGRIRELETDLTDLSGEMEAMCQRFGRVRRLLFLIADFSVLDGPDPVDVEVQERLAELNPPKSGKRKKA